MIARENKFFFALRSCNAIGAVGDQDLIYK